ncbi:MAG: DHA2 family efflux MFS transporter permease subunit, partial [Actinobacteria bacterium]|nr:DHA2 family efflux MFS transporter permease subunit [Actinomycetota bacterium]
GRLGDLFGQRRLFVAGIVLFTAASAACGLAPSPGWLVAFRAVQGIGAALLMPQTLAILTTVFPPERRGAAFGIWGAVAGVATIAGPTLGGLLVTAFDWRYIFYINVPVGAVVLVLAMVLIPPLRTGRRHRIDLPGVILASLALLAICYGLVEGQRYNWGTIASFISIPLVIGVGVVLLAVFLLVQAKTQNAEPLVPFALLRNRNYSLMNWVSGTLAIGMMGIFLPFTIYLQSVLGFSALKAGLAMAPASLMSMFVAPVAGRLSDRIGGKFILMTGLAAFAGGVGWLALAAQTDSAWYDFLPALILAGFGMGCTFAPMTTIAMRDIQPAVAGAASGLLNTTRQVGAVIGTAAVGALLQNRLVSSLTSEAATRTAGLPAPVRAALIRGFQQSARSGAGEGAGQGGSVKLPHDLPAELAARIGQIAHEVFTHGFVDAMRPTMLMPIVLLAVGAASCLLVKRTRRTPLSWQAQTATGVTLAVLARHLARQGDAADPRLVAAAARLAPDGAGSQAERARQAAREVITPAARHALSAALAARTAGDGRGPAAGPPVSPARSEESTP